MYHLYFFRDDLELVYHCMNARCITVQFLLLYFVGRSRAQSNIR
uniref:Uncharacterized protein n=1 Tax=Arundo donax TaxID=35708 RepID=A0A0A8ZXW2_ARUDO